MECTKYIINLFFFLYFIILIAERTISVVNTFTNDLDIFENGFSGFVYILVFLSIIAFLIYLIIMCRSNITAIFKMNPDLNYFNLCIASGILLLSGMVHTNNTIPWIQFISYGFLILGILLQVILFSYKEENKLLLWLSFAFLICFSMSIPVMYQSSIKLAIIFHIIEALAVFILVGTFTYLLTLIFKGENDLFILWCMGLALVFDVPLIVMRWNEEINYFLLIFVIASTILFIIGFTIKKIINKNKGKLIE